MDDVSFNFAQQPHPLKKAVSGYLGVASLSLERDHQPESMCSYGSHCGDLLAIGEELDTEEGEE
eukprot:5484404-Pyramimonas_sp.AAC.1